jgi:hypothetical protein
LTTKIGERARRVPPVLLWGNSTNFGIFLSLFLARQLDIDLIIRYVLWNIIEKIFPDTRTSAFTVSSAVIGFKDIYFL